MENLINDDGSDLKIYLNCIRGSISDDFFLLSTSVVINDLLFYNLFQYVNLFSYEL